MLKLQTPVEIGRIGPELSYGDRILVLGSCFADNIGEKLKQYGFRVCVNPFGTLYNPVSVCSALDRLENGRPFTEEECVALGAGDGRIGSFCHHTSFARETPEAFLSVANEALSEASVFYRECTKVILTLGTAWCFRHVDSRQIVANCLKRPAAEFVRERLDIPGVTALLRRAVVSTPEKAFIFTVSPIRYLKDTAHGNQLSKSILLLAVESIISDPELAARTGYFPAYEIVMDELRDYRWYADDLIHPSSVTVNYLWERFMDSVLASGEKETLLEAGERFRKSQHRPMR